MNMYLGTMPDSDQNLSKGGTAKNANDLHYKRQSSVPGEGHLPDRPGFPQRLPSHRERFGVQPLGRRLQNRLRLVCSGRRDCQPLSAKAWGEYTCKLVLGKFCKNTTGEIILIVSIL